MFYLFLWYFKKTIFYKNKIENNNKEYKSNFSPKENKQNQIKNVSHNQDINLFQNQDLNM